MTEDDKLAEAYNRGLAAEKAGDLTGAARAYGEVLALDPEDHGGASVRLASLGLADAPQTAPAAYVATLFNQNASAFDDMLVDQLGYAVPMMLRERFAALGLGPFGRMLDLGCGTGLTGASFADLADEITGVDLAEQMLDEAYERGAYDALFVGDATAFLTESGEGPWDLIAATDVLPYIGALEAFFQASAAALNPGGILAISTETLDGPDIPGFTVNSRQRFAHVPLYLSRLLSENGMQVLHQEDITVRYDEGAPVPGQLIVARQGTGTAR